jgi:hypothetical protein
MPPSNRGPDIHSPAAHSEDEYDLSFVYGPNASNADIHARSIAPLLRKVVEGYNATVLLFGATGGPRASGRGGGGHSSLLQHDEYIHHARDRVLAPSAPPPASRLFNFCTRIGSGKTTTLEGSHARGGSGSSGGASDGGGLVHLAADELFELVHSKAVAVGEGGAREHPLRIRAWGAWPRRCPNPLVPRCCRNKSGRRNHRNACAAPAPPRAGEAVARKRRVPSAKGFDFFVEASFVELHSEAAHDLLSKGAGASAALPVRGAHAWVQRCGGAGASSD